MLDQFASKKEPGPTVSLNDLLMRESPLIAFVIRRRLVLVQYGPQPCDHAMARNPAKLECPSSFRLERLNIELVIGGV